MDEPTKDRLVQWRQQGMSSREIAKITGETPARINYLIKKYKITQKKKTAAPEEIEAMCQLRREGYGTSEIARKTGYTESTVYGYLKAAGLIAERKPDPDIPLKFAAPRIPGITTVVYHGVRYKDVTDLYIPG